jgi:apolipoprotein N-acyltransferase
MLLATSYVLLIYASFVQPHGEFLVVFAVATLYLLLRLRLSLRRVLPAAALAGFGHALAVNTWMLDTVDELGFSGLVMWGLFACVWTVTLTPLLLGARGAALTKRVPLPLTMGTALAGHEVVQRWFDAPVNSLAVPLAAWPFTIQSLDIAGTAGLVIAVTGVVGCGVEAAVNQNLGRRVRFAIAGMLAAASLVAYSAWKWTDLAHTPASETRARLVQTWDSGDPPTSWDELGRLIDGPAGPPGASRPTVTVLPEATLPREVLDQQTAIEPLSRVGNPNGPATVVIAGAAVREQAGKGDRLFNSVVLLGSDGAINGRYDKRRLVVAGERPGVWGWLPGVRMRMPIAGGLTRGTHAVVWRVAGRTIAPLICSEIGLPTLAAESRRAGADIIVNPCNDMWFPRTGAPHRASAVLRAVELRVSVLRPANKGETFAVDPLGRVTRLHADRAGVLDIDLSHPIERPLAATLIAFVEPGVLALALGLVLAGVPIQRIPLCRPRTQQCLARVGDSGFSSAA